MHNSLENIVELIRERLLKSTESSYTLQLIPSVEDKKLLEYLEEAFCVQEIVHNDSVISASDIPLTGFVTVEITHFKLTNLGYYHKFAHFLQKNEFKSPGDFFIFELDYLHGRGLSHPSVESYFAIVELIDSLSLLASFQSPEDGKTVYIIQENSATSFPIFYDTQLINRSPVDLSNVHKFVSEVTTNNERKKIYCKELIDFVNTEEISKRFSHLFINFNAFYDNCETAYAFFLSDFSHSKLKLEIESAILDYSKNIRSIINDSQAKLIAIPAAFIIASSQLDLANSLSIKNFFLVFSSFIFSLLIEIFILNQESSLKIFLDNVKSYKATFKIKNIGIVGRENDNLQNLIQSSFRAIDYELINQTKRLNLIRVINWGMSSLLIFIIVSTVEIEVLSSLLVTVLRVLTSAHILY